MCLESSYLHRHDLKKKCFNLHTTKLPICESAHFLPLSLVSMIITLNFCTFDRTTYSSPNCHSFIISDHTRVFQERLSTYTIENTLQIRPKNLLITKNWYPLTRLSISHS